MFCCTHSFKVINPVMILKIFTLKLFYFSNPKLPKNKHIGETLRRPISTLRRKVIS